MPRKVVFSPTAIQDLTDSVRYIARFDPDAAQRLGHSLIDTAERYLSLNWSLGPKCREYPEGGIYYWLHKNYRIVYRIGVDEQTVEVLRFWHGSRDDMRDVGDAGETDDSSG